jgi:hypothetical protein
MQQDKLRSGIPEELLRILNEIDRLKNKDFTGLGLVVYDTDPSLLPISPLISAPDNLKVPISDTTEIVNFLLRISTAENLNHDGFHFLNNRLELTHISQYFSTPLVKDVHINLEHGSRYRTALYGSFINGIVACGVLSNNYPPSVFVKGEELKSVY